MKATSTLTYSAIIIIFCAVSLCACRKPGDTGSPTGISGGTTIDVSKALPKSVVSKNNEYFFSYNSDSVVNKIVKTPWLAAYGSYTIDQVDTISIYYNPNKTIARSVQKTAAPDYGAFQITRIAKFFEYSGTRLLKVYTKSARVLSSLDVYDPTYELVRGPLNEFDFAYLDSLTYDSKGRIAEVFRFSFDRVFGFPYNYVLNPVNYKKFQYTLANDSLLQQVTSKPNINYPTGINVGFDGYDMTAKNPMYRILRYSPFVYRIDLMPVGTDGPNTDGIGNFYSFNPYFFKSNNPPGTNPYIANTFTLTATGATYTSATYGLFIGGGGFTFYY